MTAAIVSRIKWIVINSPILQPVLLSNMMSDPEREEDLPERLREQWRLAVAAAHAEAVARFAWGAPLPVVDFKARGLGKAAAAYPAENRISINAVVAQNNPEQAFIADTASHEVAHLVAAGLFGSRNHDRDWQRVAAALGAEPRARGRFDISGSRLRKHKRYRFACDCRIHELGSIRTRRAAEGAVYRCRACHGALTPVVGDAG